MSLPTSSILPARLTHHGKLKRSKMRAALPAAPVGCSSTHAPGPGQAAVGVRKNVAQSTPPFRLGMGGFHLPSLHRHITRCF